MRTKEKAALIVAAGVTVGSALIGMRPYIPIDPPELLVSLVAVVGLATSRLQRRNVRRRIRIGAGPVAR